MPRDGSGNYTLPAGNPFVTGTTISSSTMNSTLTDIATALTGSLSRSGSGGMLVAFQNLSGTVGSPGITWSNDTASGFYLNAAGDMRVSIGGSQVGKWTSAGFAVTGTLTSSGALTVSSGGASITGTTTLAGATTISSGGLNVTGGLTVDGVSIAFAVPSVTGNSGKWLTNNGSAPSWGLMPPDQTGNAAKYLRTDGSSATGALSWTASNNPAASSSSAGFVTSSTTYVDVTNLSVAITTTGRPVLVALVPAASSGGAAVGLNGGTTYDDGTVAFTADGGSTYFAEFHFSMKPGGGTQSLYGTGCCIAWWIPAAGTYTVKCRAKNNGSGGSPDTRVLNCSLKLVEV
jgi:hypothetical protein